MARNIRRSEDGGLPRIHCPCCPSNLGPPVIPDHHRLTLGDLRVSLYQLLMEHMLHEHDAVIGGRERTGDLSSTSGQTAWMLTCDEFRTCSHRVGPFLAPKTAHGFVDGYALVDGYATLLDLLVDHLHREHDCIIGGRPRVSPDPSLDHIYCPRDQDCPREPHEWLGWPVAVSYYCPGHPPREQRI